ncbi:MAG: hypothetical protein FWD55_01450 [Propionibacteriaceae bacterium]|nr:hypothetical protein [Propionibacteriaceae bacterium]
MDLTDFMPASAPFPGPSQQPPPAKKAPTRLVVIILLVVALLAAGVAYVFGLLPWGGSKQEREPIPILSTTPSPTESALPFTGWVKTLCSSAGGFGDVAVRPDGVIVAVGTINSSDYDPPDAEEYGPGIPRGVVAFYAPDGELLDLIVAPGHKYTAVEVSPNGEVVVVGATKYRETTTNNGSIAMKFAADGTQLWTVSDFDQWDLFTYGFTGVSIEESGNITVIGLYAGDHIDDGNYFIARISENGTPGWFRSAGNLDRYSDVKTMPDNNIVVLGSSYENKENRDQSGIVMAVSLNTEGELLWYQAYTDGGSNPFYGDFTNAAITPDGILVVGYVDAPNPVGPDDETNAVIALLTMSGTLEWWQSYGGNGRDAFYGITVLPSSRIVTVGMTYSSDGDFSSSNNVDHGPDGFVANMNQYGFIESAQVYGGSSYDTLARVASTSTGIVVVGLNSSSDGNLPPTCGGADALILHIEL